MDTLLKASRSGASGNTASSSRSDSSTLLSLTVVVRPVNTLTVNPQNARIHTPKQVRQIAASIANFGFNVPLFIDDDNRVIGGHGRLLACAELGITEVPTIRLSHLTPAQARLFALAENKLVENGEWDQKKLAVEFQELADLHLDLQLELSGFEVAEIDLYILGLDGVAAEAADDVASADLGPPVSRGGDLWIAGDHRIFCGDALKREAYDVLLDGNKAALAIVDSPYNVPINGFVSSTGRHAEFAMATGEMSTAEFKVFLGKACELIAAHTAPGALCYLFMDWRSSALLQAAAGPHLGPLLNICVWSKDAAGMGSLYRSQHEFVLVFKNGTAKHQNNVMLGKFGRNRSNIWSYPGANSFARNGEEGNLLDSHSTPKPVELVADALLDASARNDLVLDSFSGSGTTLIACERTGRAARCIEIEPKYVDMTLRRWQRITGKSAVHATLQCTFDELAEAREVTRGE